jgi:hypothetical protein
VNSHVFLIWFVYSISIQTQQNSWGTKRKSIEVSTPTNAHIHSTDSPHSPQTPGIEILTIIENYKFHIFII